MQSSGQQPLSLGPTIQWPIFKSLVRLHKALGGWETAETPGYRSPTDLAEALHDAFRGALEQWPRDCCAPLHGPPHPSTEREPAAEPKAVVKAMVPKSVTETVMPKTRVPKSVSETVMPKTMVPVMRKIISREMVPESRVEPQAMMAKTMMAKCVVRESVVVKSVVRESVVAKIESKVPMKATHLDETRWATGIAFLVAKLSKGRRCCKRQRYACRSYHMHSHYCAPNVGSG